MNAIRSFFPVALCLAVSGVAHAQSSGMAGMPMDTGKGAASMPGQSGASASHEANAVVKSVDPATGKVTLAHEAVKTLNWPAMTMAFSVKDKALMQKLAAGKNVHVTFKKEGSDYVITSVK